MMAQPKEKFFDIPQLDRFTQALKDEATQTSETANDVSKRLRDAERKVRIFENIFNNMSDSVVINNFEGEVLFVNKIFEKLTGWTFDEVVGKNIEILRPVDSSADKYKYKYKEMQETLSKGQSWAGKVQNQNKDGSIIENYLVITPIMNGVAERPYFFSVRRCADSQTLWENERRLINISFLRDDRRKK